MEKNINHSQNDQNVQSELIDIIINFEGVEYTIVDKCNMRVTGTAEAIDRFEDYLDAIEFDVNA